MSQGLTARVTSRRIVPLRVNHASPWRFQRLVARHRVTPLWTDLAGWERDWRGSQQTGEGRSRRASLLVKANLPSSILCKKPNASSIPYNLLMRETICMMSVCTFPGLRLGQFCTSSEGDASFFCTTKVQKNSSFLCFPFILCTYLALQVQIDLFRICKPIGFSTQKRRVSR